MHTALSFVSGTTAVPPGHPISRCWRNMNEPRNDANPQGDFAATASGAETGGGRAEGSDDGALGRADVERASLPKIIRFDALARCGDEIWIENEGQIYRLRKTRQGKLILTK